MGKILVVIPAYNESESLGSVVANLKEKCPEADYIIVNDGSTDRTRKVCADYHFNMLDLPVNLGLSGAIRAGMKYANFYDYDYVVQIDGDGQHKAEYIKDMMGCMKNTGADIVIGSRFKSERKPVNIRMIGSQLITYAILITTGGKYIGDVTSGMRLFNKKMIKQFGYSLNYRPEPDTLAFLINHGIQIEEVQVSMEERASGTSYFSLRTSLDYMIHVLFNILFFQWVRRD